MGIVGLKFYTTQDDMNCSDRSGYVYVHSYATFPFVMEMSSNLRYRELKSQVDIIDHLGPLDGYKFYDVYEDFGFGILIKCPTLQLIVFNEYVLFLRMMKKYMLISELLIDDVGKNIVRLMIIICVCDY